MLTIEALKDLAVALCGVEKAAITGTTSAEVIEYIATNYKSPVPTTPTTAGTYNVVVGSDGTATWTAVVA